MPWRPGSVLHPHPSLLSIVWWLGPTTLVVLCGLFISSIVIMPLPDNEQVNVEFVIAVEEYPVLYNHNLKEYSNRNKQDKVWRIIADKFNSTETECKLRWRNIRNALTRFLRSKSTTGSGAKKPYYLFDHLQYLLPYTKSRIQSGNLGFSQPPSDQTPEDAEEVENEDAQDQTEEAAVEESQGFRTTSSTVPTSTPTITTTTAPTISTSTNTASSLSSWRSSKVQNKKCDPFEKAITNYFERKSTEQKVSAPDPDLSFLTSLLPDVQSLTAKKKRIFKRKVIELLEDLSEDDFCSASTPGTTPLYSTPTPPLNLGRAPLDASLGQSPAVSPHSYQGDGYSARDNMTNLNWSLSGSNYIQM